jgi:hypothetical protein
MTDSDYATSCARAQLFLSDESAHVVNTEEVILTPHVFYASSADKADNPFPLVSLAGAHS